MSVTDWFRRLFAPSSSAADTGESAPDGMAGAPGVSGYAGLEDAAAVEGVEEETAAPSDPAS